ncbi:replication initiator protein A [Flavonifractor plautii]|uniref:replication initiator protein A n=1 Tax=Flavonifractor plautii TaxID=292800 RepID=UPI00214AA092|nr:replication initiator protein A [Flavonifractor plautii]MCR1909445.1 replication initiator protein A [Flavonifractor plautii]
MSDMKLPSYFYGDEAMQFTYFRIPCQLITHPRFKHLSTDSKLLYGMLLDRMSLSIKNEWYDDTGRVYIYYTVDEVCSNLNCGRDKAMRLLAELDTGKGVGLIERKKQGQGKPTRIYVKRFTTQEMPLQPEKKPEPPAPPLGVEFADVQKSDFPTSRRRKNPPQEVEETDPNQTKRNQLDFIQPDPSIYPPAPSGRQMGIDRCEVREEVKENIEYEHLRQELPYDDVESLLELIVDVLSSTSSTIRIGGEVLPVDAVRRRFRQLDSEHIKYIIDSMSQTTTKINNIRAYLLTALYNAPITIGPYYSAAVRHDFG